MSAASSGSPEIVKALLDKGANVNELMTKGRFHALHEAAKSGCLECMKVRGQGLLGLGAKGQESQF